MSIYIVHKKKTQCGCFVSSFRGLVCVCVCLCLYQHPFNKFILRYIRNLPSSRISQLSLQWRKKTLGTSPIIKLPEDLRQYHQQHCYIMANPGCHKLQMTGWLESNQQSTALDRCAPAIGWGTGRWLRERSEGSPSPCASATSPGEVNQPLVLFFLAENGDFMGIQPASINYIVYTCLYNIQPAKTVIYSPKCGEYKQQTTGQKWIGLLEPDVTTKHWRFCLETWCVIVTAQEYHDHQHESTIGT